MLKLIDDLCNHTVGFCNGKHTIILNGFSYEFSSEQIGYCVDIHYGLNLEKLHPIILNLIKLGCKETLMKCESVEDLNDLII